MSLADGLVQQLKATQKYFKTTASVLDAADEGFAPSPETFTVAGQVAHTADSLEWFMEGAFGEGWDMDFDASVAKAKAVTSLKEASALLDRAFADAIATIQSQSDEQLQAPIADTRIMGGAPRLSVVSAIVDHTAHHRGSLAVYARLLGKVPVMPYT
jgi:uncharacterized damage-inducible protein DinB